MANTQLNDIQNTKIQAILARYLELRSGDMTGGPAADHLDEDSLNAFTEGRLLEREATPVVSHLTGCSFCRHRTVELVRLEMHFAEQDEAVPLRESGSEPTSVSSVLSGVLSRIFGSGEAAVFAHEEKADDDDPEDRDPSENKDDRSAG